MYKLFQEPAREAAFLNRKPGLSSLQAEPAPSTCLVRNTLGAFFETSASIYATLIAGTDMTIRSSTQIGNVIRNAVVFNVKNWLGDMVNSDSFLQSVQDLFAVLEQRKIDYVLVGGIALLYYVEGRNTQDLDLLMTSSSLKKLPELKVTSQDMDIVRADYNGLQIDVLLTRNPLFNTVHYKYSINQHFLDRDIPIGTMEGLLLLKLYALPTLYRRGNFARVGIYENDIATLLHYYQPELSMLLGEMSKYVNESDLTEIKNIVKDIQNRLNRFKNESH